MKYKVLVIDSDPLSLRRELKALSVRDLTVVGTTHFQKACSLLREDGAIHAVLSEWSVPLSDKSPVRLEGAALFQELLRLRWELNLFLFTSDRTPANAPLGGLINGYFCKTDEDYDDIVQKVRAEVINSKNRAPFFEQLEEYCSRSKDSWHTPGHASGYSLKSSPYVRDMYEFFGKNIFKADVSVSVPMLDSLLHPTGVLKEAQELAARAFGSRYTFFSTNGTSTSNKVILQTLLRPGDAILLDRNCHKSVHYGVIISGAEPLYLLPSVNNRYGIFGPVPKARILQAMDKALAAGKRLKALMLTNCTYDGLIYDLPGLIEAAHARGVKVIVDEAWFGYARFHPHYYPSAISAGADYATQSTHKTMSAFSQASMIHVNDPDFENLREFFMENFNMHTSTSPQYPMLASLDVARKQMVMEGYTLLSRALELSNTLRKAANSLSKFRVLGLEDMISPELAGDRIRLDPTKLTLDVSRTGYSSREVEELLFSKYNVQIEKSTFNTLSILVTIGATQSKIQRLILALQSIEQASGNVEEPSDALMRDFRLSLSPLYFTPRDAYFCEGERVMLREAVGRISSGMVVPYPPGIPLLVPGQVVSEEIVNTLQTYRDQNVEIHGMTDGTFKVMRADEEARLSSRRLEPLAE